MLASDMTHLCFQEKTYKTGTKASWNTAGQSVSLHRVHRLPEFFFLSHPTEDYASYLPQQGS